MPPLSWDVARRILKENNTPQNVVEHCSTVSVFASELAEKIKANGHEIDVDFVKTSALLHDIGRCRTHGIRHGLEGANILKDLPEYARVCECHIGAGISKDEAMKLGLPPEDYIPRTLEEKVVCYADKLVEGDKRVKSDRTIRKFRQRLGPDHPTIGRIIELDREIRGLTDD
jgi:uncharacterized protein